MVKFICLLLLASPLLLTSGCSKNAKASRHLSRADKYLAAGLYSSAEVEYMNVLRLDNRNARAIARLGVIYFDEGRPLRALPFLIKASELTTNDLDLRVRLGNIYLSLGKAAEARENALLVLSKAPTNAEAPMLLAESVTNRAQADEVRQRLEKLAAGSGDSASLQLAFGTLHLRGRELEAAEVDFKRALALDSKSSAAHAGLATLCLAKKDIKGAELELKAASDLAPVRSNRRINYAGFKIQNGEVEEGKSLLRAISKTAPDYLPAWLRQAEIALAEKKYDDCASLLTQALAQDPGDYEALILRSRLALARRETARAIAELERLSGSPPMDRSAQVHYLLALAYLQDTNDTAKALKSLHQSTFCDPNFAEATLLEAHLKAGQGDTAAAITSLTELLKRQPRLPMAYLELAGAYSAKGELEPALAAYRQLRELLPANPEAPFRMGLIYLQQARRSEAREAFTKTIKLVPGYIPAIEKLVDLDLLDEQYTNAFARVQMEMEKNPTNAEPHLLLAKIHMARAQRLVNQEMKREKENKLAASDPHLLLVTLPAAAADFNQAEAALLKAIESNPNSHEPYLILARLYVDTRKNPKALEKLADALGKDPKDTRALMLMATIQNETKDFSAARATYEKLLAVNPNFYSALNNLAYLYAEKFNELDKAYDMARKARDLLSYTARSGEDEAQSKARNSMDFLRAYSTDTLGWIVFKRGEYTYALSLLQESAGKLSSEPEVEFHLGMACYMLGLEDRAQTALKIAAATERDFPGKPEATRRLAVLAINPKLANATVIASLEKQLRKQSGDPVALARLAAIYERNGAFQKALKAYENALNENRKNLPVLINLARMYSALGDTSRALELAKEAYKLAPTDPSIVSVLGSLVFSAGDHKWALSLLELVKDTQKPEVLYNLAWAYFSVGRVSDSESTMRAVLQANVPFSQTNEAKWFAELAPASTDPAKAIPAESRAREWLKSEPDNAPALMVIGMCSQQRGDTVGARQQFERVLNHFPEFVPAAKHLATIYADEGSEKGYDLAVKSREAFPQDPEIARALGIAFFLRKDYSSAVRLLEESVRAGVGDAKTMYYLGMSHYNLSREAKNQPVERKQTKDALERALALNIQPQLAADAKRVLSELQ